MSYGHTITLDLPFLDAVSKVKDAFGAQGFGRPRAGRHNRERSAVSGTAALMAR
jgi:hypothetical protein